MSLIETEGPIVLGYLLVVAAIVVGVTIVILLDPTYRARRRRNAIARRIRRHALNGCRICTARALDAAYAEDLAREANLDVDAWLDYPTGGPR